MPRLARDQGRAERRERPAGFAASRPCAPLDYWRHRSPAAECQALVEVLPQFSRLTTGYPNSYEYV